MVDLLLHYGIIVNVTMDFTLSISINVKYTNI